MGLLFFTWKCFTAPGTHKEKVKGDNKGIKHILGVTTVSIEDGK